MHFLNVPEFLFDVRKVIIEPHGNGEIFKF